MELKDRKRINNLPGFVGGYTGKLGEIKMLYLMPTPPQSYLNQEDKKPSSAASAGPWFALGEWAGSGVAAGINSIQRTDDVLLNAGTSTGYVNGIAYQKGNDIDAKKLMTEYDRELGKSFLTNPFKGLTMAFGRRKLQLNIRRALLVQASTNLAAMSGAATDYLQQEYAKEYGNPESQMLYAKNGKDAVLTSEGEFNVFPNSKTEGGEIIYNKLKGTAHVIPGKADGDNNYSSVLPSDIILSNKFGLASRGRMAAKALESINKKKNNRGSLGNVTDELIKSLASAVLDNLAEEQRMYKEIGALPRSNDNVFWGGKNPFGVQMLFLMPSKSLFYFGDDYESNNKKKRKFSSSWLIDGIGALTSLGNLISDATQKVKRPNTDVEPNDALDVLASLRVNLYPINKQINDQLRRNLYANDRIGLLSGSQKAYANIASGLGALSTIAESNANTQKQNNLFFSDYAKYASSLWKDRALAKTQTNQWDLDYYSQAHAAKQQMVQQGFLNILAALQQGYYNANKKYQFDKTMANYNIA